MLQSYISQRSVIGYSEMKRGGIFEPFAQTLRANPDFSRRVLLFRHFSMNQFTIDLRRQSLPGESVSETLERIDSAYRTAILCF